MTWNQMWTRKRLEYLRLYLCQGVYGCEKPSFIFTINWIFSSKLTESCSWAWCDVLGDFETPEPPYTRVLVGQAQIWDSFRIRYYLIQIVTWVGLLKTKNIASIDISIDIWSWYWGSSSTCDILNRPYRIWDATCGMPQTTICKMAL